MGFISKNSHPKFRYSFWAASIVNGKKWVLLHLSCCSSCPPYLSYHNDVVALWTRLPPLPNTCFPGCKCLRWISFCPVLSFLRSLLFPSRCTFAFQHWWYLLPLTVSCAVLNLKLSSSVWPAFCKDYFGSTLSGASLLPLLVLHPQSVSHGCKSQIPVNITSCTTRLLTCRC